LEESSRLTSGVNPPTARFARTPHDSEAGVSHTAHSDLNIARITKANLLLVGHERLVSNALSLLVPDPTADGVIGCEGGRLMLPPPSERIATLVVRDVDALTADEQQSLLEWLDSSKIRTRVVSTASEPLLPLVATRAFNDTLYYRLNTVYIDLSE